MRIFVGITPPAPVSRQLRKLLKELKRKHWPVKWIEVKNLHFTLVFLGELEKERLVEVARIVGQGCNQVNQFTLKVKGLGCFPDYFQPRVIWLGLRGDLKALVKLQKTLRSKLTKSDFSLDERPFQPHVTLGRIKQARFKERKEIGRQLRGLKIKEIAAAWPVKKVEIYQSRTLSEGPVYQLMKEFKLK